LQGALSLPNISCSGGDRPQVSKHTCTPTSYYYILEIDKAKRYIDTIFYIERQAEREIDRFR